MRKEAIAILIVMALLCGMSVLALGQAETGQITGTVTDPSGAIVPNAKVVATDVNTGASRTVTSNGAGLYTITNLKPSSYDLQVEATGFAKFNRRIEVTVGSKNEVPAQLSLVSQGTVVDVTAENSVATVNTESQTLSTVITSKQVSELPTLTRNPYDLVATSGNVAPDPTATVRGTGFAINGARSSSTDVLLDGGENVDLFTSEVGQSVPLDSVQEFRVVTSDFTAEYGRASGGVVNVATKSGTNAFHGSAYEFNRISALAANTWENDAQNLPKGIFTRNQFGYSVGGPIIKNKLFFFSSTEWTRVRSTFTQTAAIIDPALLASGLLNQKFVDFFNQWGTVRPGAQVLEHISCADMASHSGPGCPGGIDPATPLYEKIAYTLNTDAGGGLPQNTYSNVNRVDWNATDRTSIFGRYAVYSEHDFIGTNSYSPYAGFDTDNKGFNNNVLINVTHVFSPNFVSQSKLTFNRLNNIQPLGAQPVGPTLYALANGVPTIDQSQLLFPGYLPAFPGNSLPFGGPQNLYQVYQDFSWTKGRHQFRFGGQYVQTRDNRVFGAYETGVSTLSLSDPNSAIANLFGGTIDQYQVAVDPKGAFPCYRYQAPTPSCLYPTPASAPKFSRNNRYNDGAWYVQDSWKATPRLTVNAGLRWEYYGVQHNSDPSLDSNFYEGPGSSLPQQVYSGQVMVAPKSPIGGLWNKDLNNFAPRVGFAWDVFGDGKTSIRGGYGIGYERNFGNVTFNVIQNPPNYAVAQYGGVPGAGVPLPVTNFDQPDLIATGSQPLPPASLRLVSPNIPTAYNEFWSFSLEHEVLKNSVVAFEYTGSHGVHLYDLGNINKSGFGDFYDPADMNKYAQSLGLADETQLPCYPFCKLNMQYGNANNRGAHGFSHYNALNSRFSTNNFMNLGLQLNFNWTWSHSIDNLSNTFSEGTNGTYQLGYVDYFHPNLDKGSSEFDARHRIAISGVWDLPWGSKSSSVFVREALGGWSISPLFTYQTGNPYSIFDCTNAVYNCPHWIPGRPQSTSGSANASTYAGNGTFNYLSIPVDPSVNWGPAVTGDPNAQLYGPYGTGVAQELPLAPCQDAVGCQMLTGSRDMFVGPGNHQFNVVFGKTFKLSERFNLQFRGEMYDAFNNHNYYLLTSNAEALTLLVGPNQSNTYVQAVKGGFGNALDERRNVQFGLKLLF